ncbi:MAG: hypothetical protein A2451_10775 [Bdellovibrionales bacterium RIFOXYC2_FULL_39_8]|nr:MAG: hypothetical protein A2451_10775 [Bdellovibrionales bacterium RIFOXYC2_FULL_39_8]
MSKILILSLMFGLLISCGQDRQLEVYDQMQEGNLDLTESNHAHGWQQTDCFYCHVMENIHQADQQGCGIVVAGEMTDELSDCLSSCHGQNGVE